MIRGIHHVAIHVNDLDRMIRFYREAFNFELHRPPFDWADEKGMDLLMDVKGTSGRQAVLRAGNCYLELFQFNTPSPNSKQPLRPNDKGYTHFCVDVTDIEVEFERLKGVGMVFGH